MTANYLMMLFCASFFSAIAGLIAHWWRSEVGPGTGANEDPLYEKGFLVVMAPMEDRVYEKRVIQADWNEYGWWEFASKRNIIYYVGGGAVWPWVVGILAWPHQDEILGKVCAPVVKLGIIPLFCS